MHVFISHSSRDAARAEEACRLLEQAGHTCFIAPRDIPSGKEYAQEIMLGIERSQAVLLMLSANSNSSPHVLREIEHAVSRSLPIVVYKMEEVELNKSMEYFLMTHQWMNQKSDKDYGAIVKCIDSLQSDGVQNVTPQAMSPQGISQKYDNHSDAEKPAQNQKRKNKLATVLTAVVAAAAVLAAVTIPFASRRSKRRTSTRSARAASVSPRCTLRRRCRRRPAAGC